MNDLLLEHRNIKHKLYITFRLNQKGKMKHYLTNEFSFFIHVYLIFVFQIFTNYYPSRIEHRILFRLSFRGKHGQIKTQRS